MNQEIQQLLSTLSRKRMLLIALTESLSEAELRDKPSAEAWSLLEVLHHLTLVEKNTFRTMSKHVAQAAQMPKVTFLQKCKNAALRMLLKTPLSFKVPIPHLEPSAEERVQNLLETWNELEVGWQPLLVGLDESALGNGLVAHPIAGWMSAEQALRLLSQHFDHHLPQLKKGLRRLSRDELIRTLAA